METIWTKEEKENSDARKHSSSDVLVSELMNEIHSNTELKDLVQKNNVAEIHRRIKKTGLNMINPGNGDKLASFLFGLKGIKIFYAGIIATALGCLPVLISVFEGNFCNDGLRRDALHDLGFIDIILATSSLVILSSMYFGAVPLTLFQLTVSNTVPLTLREWEKFQTRADAIFHKKVITWTPYIIGVILALFVPSFYLLSPEPTWYRISFTKAQNATVAGWFIIPLTFCLYYLITMCLLRIIGTFIVLNNYFKHPPNIQPLHPDCCGGLSPLGKLSMKLNLGAFIFGIVAVIAVIVNIRPPNDMPIFHPLNLLLITGYLVGASIAFFLPLFAAHHAMKESKYRVIQIINQNYQRVNDELMKVLQSSKNVDSKTIDELDSLKNLHDIAFRMPVYPLNFQTVSSFFGSICAPLLIFALQILIGKFFNNT